MHIKRLLLFILGIYLIQSKVIKPKGFFDAMSQIQKDVDFLASLLIYSSSPECTQCKAALSIYEDWSNEVDGIVKAYAIDCAKIQSEIQHLHACNPINIQRLPQLSFLTPPANVEESETLRNPIENRITGTFSRQSLLKAVDEYSPSFYSIINSLKQLKAFLKDTTMPYKVVLLTEGPEVPHWFIGLVSHFHDRLGFSWIDTDRMDVPKEYNHIGMYPDVLILKYDSAKDSYIQVPYNGGKRLESLRDHLSRLASKEKLRTWKSRFEQDYTKWNKVEQLEHPSIPTLMIREEAIMIHFTTDGQSHPRFVPLKEQFRGLLTYFEVDCSRDDCTAWIRDNIKLKTFPNLIIYPMSKKQLDDPHVISKDETIDVISKYLKDDITVTSKTFVQYDDIQIYSEIKKAVVDQYHVLLWLYDSKDHYWNLIANSVSEMSKYKGHIKFLFFKDPNTEAKEIWGVDVLPKIIGFADVNLETGNHKRYQFEDPLLFENVLTFLDSVALHHEQTIKSTMTVPESLKQMHFDVLCLQTGKPCVIAFLDTVNLDKFQIDLDALKKSAYGLKADPLSWTWIDGKCQASLMKILHFTDLPQLIYYQPKNNRYQVMQDDYNTRNINSFLQSIKDGKKTRKLKLDDQIDLEDVQCLQLREVWKKEFFEQSKRQNDL